MSLRVQSPVIKRRVAVVVVWSSVAALWLGLASAIGHWFGIGLRGGWDITIVLFWWGAAIRWAWRVLT